MTNSKLNEALASANEVIKKDELIVDATKTDEIGDADLDLISGGLMDAAAECKGMVCGVF
jgi:hypothetical protein